jgi:C4-dicarboxylate-specific signal transduction histidine kinase
MQMELAPANRIATMGQLTASITHEFSQPIAATVVNARAALRWVIVMHRIQRRRVSYWPGSQMTVTERAMSSAEFVSS